MKFRSTLAAALLPVAAAAATQDRLSDSVAAVVAGYEHLRASAAVSETALGEVLLGELNCLSCHTVSDASRNGIADRITTKPAPDLSTIGRRATPGWLLSFLSDPHGQKPGTTMPDLLHDFPAAERAAIAERLVHFLVDQGGAMPSPSFEPFRFSATVERGRALFHSIGCVACHAGEGETSAPAIPDVPLPDLTAKTSVAALAEFLLDPMRVRHGGRMPSLYLTKAEAQDVAVYLLRKQEPDVVRRLPGFEFEYFVDPMQDEDAEEFFSRSPPVLDTLDVTASGRIDALSLDLPTQVRRGNHLFRFSGLLPIEAAGLYTFVLRSDRPSRSELLIDGRVVATKDRDTGREIPIELELEAGNHTVAITYYIRGDTEEPYLEVTIQGAVARPIPIDEMAVSKAVRLAPPNSSLAVDSRRSREGRRAFRELGCASCHAFPASVTGAAPLTRARSLDALDPVTLTAEGPIHQGAGEPHYNLGAHQRRALGAALTNLDALTTPRDAPGRIVHALATYNCLACHQRGEAGGLDPVRRRHFKVVGGMDLGDEGRIPPRLTGIGGKLKPDALDSVLRESRLHVRRNYMEARMPRFGGNLVGGLAAAFEGVDATPGDLQEPSLSSEAIDDGRKLVGSEGMRCITCHDVGANLAQGISTVNLASVYDRLRPGWVRQLLIDPHSLNEGTRMVPYWSDEIVLFPDIAGGTADGQVDAILSYMSLGASMPAPAGTNIGDAMVLAPEDEPIVFRTFMTGVSPRAIVVGYPESVHVAFDANVIRLAKAWRGGFFDAQGTWRGRAGRFFEPYGDDVMQLPPGPALAFLDNAEAPWPPVMMTDRNVGGRFIGYRLDEERRPVFMYELEGVLVEEQPVPVVSAGGANLLRRFSLEAASPSGRLYLLVAEGEEILQNDDGSWTLDGSATVTLRGNAPLLPFVRTSQGVRQLLLPVEFLTNRNVSLEVKLSW